MRGFWIGPIDPVSFLKSFLPTSKKVPSNKLSKASFKTVPTETSLEPEMHEPLVSYNLRHNWRALISFGTGECIEWTEIAF